MKPKPLPRNSSSVSRMWAAATSIEAFSRKNVVPTTASSPWASRSSPASSSSPVASGTRALTAGGHADRGARGVDVELLGRELLRAAAAVARAPALVGPVHDHRADLQDPVDEALRARWAARDVQVDREELVRRDD